MDSASVTVTGHTDSIGSQAYNQKLSERRAATVAKVLREQGIAVDKAAVSGKSENEPVGDNKTAMGRAKNRRTEVHVQGSMYKVNGQVETDPVLGSKKEAAAAAKAAAEPAPAPKAKKAAKPGK